MGEEELNRLSEHVIGAAMEVHKELGPGLLESAYEACLAHELELRGLAFERQKAFPVRYKNLTVKLGYRLDLLVEGELVVELKAIESVEPVHKAQLLSYLKLMDRRLGLLINFNVKLLKQGIRRIVNGL